MLLTPVGMSAAAGHTVTSLKVALAPGMPARRRGTQIGIEEGEFLGTKAGDGRAKSADSIDLSTTVERYQWMSL
jgi:hypothetical protein